MTLAPLPGVVYQQRLASRLAHSGDMMFRGENPANGITFTVWSRDSGTAAILAVKRVGHRPEVWRQSTRDATRCDDGDVESSRSVASAAAIGEWRRGTRRRSAPNQRRVRNGRSYQVTLTVGDRVWARERSRCVRIAGRMRRQRPWPRGTRVSTRSRRSIERRRGWQSARAVALETRAARGHGSGTANSIGALHQSLEAQVGSPTADMRAQLASFSRLYVRLERAVAGR